MGAPSIKGFVTNEGEAHYDFNYLDNVPEVLKSTPTAKVGQYLRVEAVDAKGKILSVSAVDVEASSGESGGYYSLQVTQPTPDTMKIEFTPSDESMDSIEPQLITLPAGKDGSSGKDGNGIKSVVLNNDYTLTLTFDDDTSYTTPSIRGEQGATGPQGEKGEKGDTGPQGEQGIQGEKGDKGDIGPSGKDGSDYILTEADKSDIARIVVESLGGNPVFGYVDENNNIIVQGNLPNGTYTVKYENEDDSTIDIGQLILDNNVYFSVTNDLTNCTSTGADQAIGGQSYKATISPNSGHELSSLSVIMDGVDITSEVVSGGSISIASVTGDIVITAKATEVQTDTSYTNLANPSDTNWKEGIRLNSSYSEVEYEGMVTTNFISASKGDVIRVKGLSFGNNTYERVVQYINMTTPNNAISSTDNNDLFVTNDGITTITLNGSAVMSNSTLVRICGTLTGTSDDVIITVNEGIIPEDGTDEPAQTYTNQIPISTDAEGNLFVGTNGEAGYKTGYRISLSGGNESATDDYECTGFIPCTKNDIIRIKNIDLTDASATNITCYDSNKQPIAVNSPSYGTTLYYMFVQYGTQSGDVYSSKLTNVTFLKSLSNVAYIRISSESITADSILTRNEEIV